MAVENINLRQLGLICRYSLRHSMRGGSGLVFVLLALFFSLTVANIVVSPFELLVSLSEQEGRPVDEAAIERTLANAVRPAVQFAVAPPPTSDPERQQAAELRAQRWAEYALDERPALLSAIFFVLLFGTPLLIPFGAFNQTASDIGSRGLRYLLPRTARPNIYLGRLVSTMLLVGAIQAAVVATIALYVGLKLPLYGGPEVVAWSAHGLVALVVVSLPYVALCGWISASHESATVSLLMCNVVIGGVLLVASLAASIWQPAHFLRFLLPWGVQNYLLSPSTFQVAASIAACFCYTALFVWLGARKFGSRDL